MTSSKKKALVGPKIIFLLFAALSIRLFLFYWQYSGDVKNHLVWADSLLKLGPFGLFDRHFTGFNDVNYPPITLLLFSLSRFIYQNLLSLFTTLNHSVPLFPSLLVPFFASFNMQVAFLKLPAIFADLGIGYLLYRRHRWLSILYLFNPAVIYISTVWGQVESLPIFFLLLSLFFLPKKYYLSHLAFLLALLSKQTALWVLPVYLILWWKQGNARKLFIGFLLQLAVFIVIYLPFTLPRDAVTLYLGSLSGSSNYVSDQALNLWYFVYGWARQSDSIPLFGLPVRLWSLLFLSPCFAYLLIRFFKKFRLQDAGNYLFFLSLVAFFFQTRVHDRHFAPVLPFLLISSYQNKFKIPLYLFLSAYHLFNLYLALRLPFI